MKYTRGQFTTEYYKLWDMGLLLATPQNASLYSVKYRKNHFDEYSRVTLKAVSVSDALERACYAITYNSLWRPEEIDLHAVYDEEDNLLWIDEPYYEVVQKKNEFRGMERREFLAKFGATSAAILFGLLPDSVRAATTTVGLSGAASGFNVMGEQLYATPGSYSWTAPAGVTSVCVVCVGGGGANNGIRSGPSGGAGSGGGGLGWKNMISVTPGLSYSTVSGGENLDSYFINTVTVKGGGGNYQIGGSYTGDGGGNGGSGGGVFTYDTYGQGGGGGGGVGLYGVGTNGLGGSSGTFGMGGGGSGGSSGGAANTTNRGVYGGGCGSYGNGGGNYSPGLGAVRIIWGMGRSFPNNAT